MKYTALIIDDERNGAESLNLLLNMYCPQIKIVGIEDNVAQAIEAIETLDPQIVFLDIELPSGSGIEIAERTRLKQRSIIFTTAYENYALKAFKVNACDYLLKPIEAEDLIKAVNKATEEIDSKLPKDSKISSTVIKNKLAIPSSDGLVFIEHEHILRIEADSNYVHLVLKDQKKITTCKTLKEIEKIVPQEIFHRIHNKHIVNLNYIKKYIRGDGGFVLLIDDSLIPVSRSQKSTFLAHYV
jgi:two-component system, LytTR family, response regulator